MIHIQRFSLGFCFWNKVLHRELGYGAVARQNQAGSKEHRAYGFRKPEREAKLPQPHCSFRLICSRQATGFSNGWTGFATSGDLRVRAFPHPTPLPVAWCLSSSNSLCQRTENCWALFPNISIINQSFSRIQRSLQNFPLNQLPRRIQKVLGAKFQVVSCRF